MSERPFDQQLREAVRAGRERRYREAASLLTDLLRNSDEYPEAVLYLGRSYHALGEHARAVTVLTFFLRLAPASAAAHFFLGRAYLALDRNGPALRHFRRSTSLRSGYVPALALAGIAALRCRRPGEAVEHLQKAVEKEPDNQRVFTAYLNALLTHAIKLFRDGELPLSGQMLQFILRHQAQSVTAHVYLGRIFRELDKTRPALEHFEAASLLAPDDPSLKLQKATLYLQTGEPDRAVAELRQATTGMDAKAFLTRDPTELSRLLAVSFFQNGRYREAVDYGLRVLRDSKGEPHTHVVVAEALRNLGDLPKARNHYLRALEGERGNPQILFGLAMVLLAQEDYEELGSVLARLERAQPGDPTVAYYLALCRSRKGDDATLTIGLLQRQIRERGPDPFLMLALGKDYLRADLPDLAEGWFRRTLKMRADDREAALGLLQATEKLGQTPARIDAYTTYLKLEPQDHARRRELVKLLMGQGDHTAAVPEIERLIPNEPNNRTLRELLALCYRKVGRFTDAVVILKELIRAEPRSEEHVKALVYCLEKSGGRPLALRLLDRALPAFPKSAVLRQIHGLLLVRDGENERAAAVFREVIALSPRAWVAYEQLSNIHRKLGDTTFADKFAARARALKGAAARGSAGRQPPRRSPR